MLSLCKPSRGCRKWKCLLSFVTNYRTSALPSAYFFYKNSSQFFQKRQTQRQESHLATTPGSYFRLTRPDYLNEWGVGHNFPLQCCSGAKALLTHSYSLCIIIKFKFKKVQHVMTPSLLLLLQPGFLSTSFIFSFNCQMQLKLQVNWLLPPSCLSTRDTADAVSGYCSNSEWQLECVNEKEKWERWLRCMAEWLANLWPDCWINHAFCFIQCVRDWQSILL